MSDYIVLGIGAVALYGVLNYDLYSLTSFEWNSKMATTNSDVSNKHDIKTSNGVRRKRHNELKVSQVNNPKRNQNRGRSTSIKKVKPWDRSKPKPWYVGGRKIL